MTMLGRRVTSRISTAVICRSTSVSVLNSPSPSHYSRLPAYRPTVQTSSVSSSNYRLYIGVCVCLAARLEVIIRICTCGDARFLNKIRVSEWLLKYSLCFDRVPDKGLFVNIDDWILLVGCFYVVLLFTFWRLRALVVISLVLNTN